MIDRASPQHEDDRLAARALELIRAYGRIRRLDEERHAQARESGEELEERIGWYVEEDEALERIRELADELAEDR